VSSVLCFQDTELYSKSTEASTELLQPILMFRQEGEAGAGEEEEEVAELEEGDAMGASSDGEDHRDDSLASDQMLNMVTIIR